MKASKSPYLKLDWISTGYTNLDKAMGGGIPMGKIVQASGRFSVGKSTLGYSILSAAQEQGKDTLLADSEYSFDSRYCESLGVNLDDLDLIQHRLGEDLFDGIVDWITTHKDGVIVLDSIGNILPRSEAEKRSGEVTIGAQARLIAPFLKKINGLLVEKNIGIFICNHEKGNLMDPGIYTPGGKAMEHFTDIWLRMKKSIKKVMKADEMIGRVVEVVVWKNKLASTEGKKTELMIVFGKGFNKEADLFGEAADKGVIKKVGQFWHYDKMKWRGDSAMRDALKDETLAAEIKEKVRTI